MANRLYDTRSRITVHATIGRRVVVLAILGMAVFLLVEGSVTIGLLVLLASGAVGWLAGLWVLPGGADAFARKLSIIMRDASANMSYGRYQCQEKKRLIRNEIEDSDPPPRYSSRHQSILANMRRAEAAMEDRSGSLVDSAIISWEVLKESCSLRSELRGEDGEPYAGRVVGALDRYGAVVVAGMGETLASLQSHRAQIVKLNPPEMCAVRHDKYLSALTVYALAVGNYNVAAKGENREAVRQAAIEMANTYSVLATQSHEYAAELRQLWVSPKISRSPRGLAQV